MFATCEKYKINDIVDDDFQNKVYGRTKLPRHGVFGKVDINTVEICIQA